MLVKSSKMMVLIMSGNGTSGKAVKYAFVVDMADTV